jgi:exonuclease III
LTIITLNCRGLGNINKFRLLLNKMYEVIHNTQAVIMLQETMILDDSYLKMAWRGNFVLTPGTGNSKGCLTLTNSNLTIEHVHHFGNRGHYFTLTGLNGNEPTLVMNIYAPNGYNDDKTNFFIDTFDTILTYDCDIILAGDFNVTLRDVDRHNRGTTINEDSVAKLVIDNVTTADLSDVWDLNKKSGMFTWRRGKIMSRLDRIYTRLEGYQQSSITVDWTYTTTDHAAVVATFKVKVRTKKRNAHIKLDDDIVKNPDTLQELKTYLIEQLNEALHLNPHLLLDFAKMTIRTKAMDINARLRRKINSELSRLNAEILTNSALLIRYTDENSQRVLSDDIDEATRRKNAILQEQGEKLAHRAKTKWYNEGEKSNKYFLNLLKRQAERSDMNILNVNGVDVDDNSVIVKEVQNYYSELYNQDTASVVDDTFFSNMFTLPAEQNACINAPITLDELWSNLKGLKATTPGPDGLSNTYLKKLWDILGPLILSAWEHSLIISDLPSSHKTSMLRLIPKAGKDTKLLKNWRPITLSNCDHKLITRTYNKRLLNNISQHISATQTAYIKGRNIADNLRLLNALLKTTDIDENIDGTVIALDAQKAFDSVSHDYLCKILNRIGLTNFVPIFQLLYKDLKNDIIINGSISGQFFIKNGVKQGDALSCSLFILAIEPVIRNINMNPLIRPINSRLLSFKWPKVLAYADDLTILTENSDISVNEIFREYHRLSLASCLYLNADKTEKFNVFSRNIPHPAEDNDIEYGDHHFTLRAQNKIKINGIHFDRNGDQMLTDNFQGMLAKMTKHFKEWSKRSLSLLGKIQIIKTFGISQYLYGLAILEFLPEQWGVINKLINKFLWNRNFNTRNAPHRLKSEIVYRHKLNGGLGMIPLTQIATSIKIKRFATLMDGSKHPIAKLQLCLGAGEHLRSTPRYDVDYVTTISMLHISESHKRAYPTFRLDQLAADRLTQNKLLGTKIIHVIKPVRVNSIEHLNLRRDRLFYIRDLLIQPNGINSFLRICEDYIREICQMLWLLLVDDILPNESNDRQFLYNPTNLQWLPLHITPSSIIRNTLFPEVIITRTKLMEMTEDRAKTLYKMLHQVGSLNNRTKLLRLLYGDVYCGSRTYRFGLTETDRCIRCFASETIRHLLLECPYTSEVWDRLGLAHSEPSDILNPDIAIAELEIRAEFISEIVFRKQNIPPDRLISKIMTAFSKGLSRNARVTRLAKNLVDFHAITGTWYS